MLSAYPPASSIMPMHPDVNAHTAPQKSPDNVMSMRNVVLLNCLWIVWERVAMHMPVMASKMY